MPIFIIGGLLGAFVTHAWHSEVKRQAQQEARLNELHEKMSSKMGSSQEKKS